MFSIVTINNQFSYAFPLDFVPDELEELYLPLLKNQRKPYASVLDYLNSTIQDITFPGINYPVVKQIMKFGKETNWKGNQNIYDLFDKTGTITLLNVDSNLNYMIILHCLNHHYLNVQHTYDQNLIMTMVDQNRKVLYFFQYRSLIFTSLDANKFAYNDQQIQTKTFTMTFTSNYFDMEYVGNKFDCIINEDFTNYDLVKLMK